MQSGDPSDAVWISKKAWVMDPERIWFVLWQALIGAKLGHQQLPLTTGDR